jgi:hypothetical protein
MNAKESTMDLEALERGRAAHERAAEAEEAVPCPVCGGALGLLGVLGRLAHFTCRDCGATHSEEVPR